MIISSRIIKKIKVYGSWPVLVIIIFIISFSACTNVLRPTIKKQSVRIKNEKFIILYPHYSYNETLGHDPQEKRYWIFAKDSLKFYKMATDALNQKVSKSNGRLSTNNPIYESRLVDSVFKMLQRNELNSLQTFLYSNMYSDSLFVFLHIKFDVYKGQSGASGLGSANEGIVLTNYYADIAVVQNKDVIYYKSVIRNFSPFRRMFSIERSRNLIESLFKDVW